MPRSGSNNPTNGAADKGPHTGAKEGKLTVRDGRWVGPKVYDPSIVLDALHAENGVAYIHLGAARR